MIRTRLMEHQIKVVDFAKSEDTEEYMGVFSDYGTGKSLCALQIIQDRQFKAVLVVSTSLSIDTTWCDEIRKHSDFRFCILKGTAKQKVNLLDYAMGQVRNPKRYGYGESSKPMLFLINYEGVRSIYYELQRAGFDAIFADESTKIKTFNSQRTMALQEVGRFTKFRCVMTGFPVTEALFELYSQIKFLDLGNAFGNSYYAFLNKYFVRQGYKTIVKKKSIKEIMDKIKPFCIRITNETLKLPPKTYKSIQLDMTDQQRELLLKFNETFKIELGKVKLDTKYIFTLLSKSLEICDGFVHQVEYEKIEKDGKIVNGTRILSETTEVVDTHKDEALIEILEEIDVTRNKVVIWSAFLFSVAKIKRILTKLGVNVLTLTGEAVDSNKIVQMFQRSNNHNVLICTQKKAAESVTLTSARYAIYYSNMWSNDLRLNSEARIRRKGSEKHRSIIYVDLITKGTVEEKVYECLRKKKSLIDELKNAFLEMKR